MAPKKKTKKKIEKAVKPPSGMKKAWGKERGKKKDDEDNPTGAPRGLKPFRIKLDKETRDAILDILHQLHVVSADDGAEDYSDDSDEDEDEDGDEGGGEDREDSGGDTSKGDSRDGSESVEIDDSDDEGDGDLTGDFENDGSFAVMANLMSELVINQTPLNGSDEDQAVSAAAKIKGKEKGGPGESWVASGSKKGSQSDSPVMVAGKKRQQGEAKSPSIGGVGSRGASRSNVTREKLLASMVQEDRKASREESQAKGGVPSAAIAAASTIGGGLVGRVSRDYQRPDPPAAGKGNEKVRLEVCGESKKTGAPDLNGKKMLVFDRKEPIQKFLDTCRGKLHIKKKAKGAAFLEGVEIVDWMLDLSWVPNGSVVLVSSTGPPKPIKRSPPPSSFSSLTSAEGAAPASVTNEANGQPLAAASDGNKVGGAETSEEQEEEEEEALALNALDRIRQTYKVRAKRRQSEAGRRGGGVSDEEMGKRMIDKKQAVKRTTPFRKMMAQRESLPAFSQRKDIVDAIRDNQVIVLSGETGCGKTTQVPQFVLDSLVDQGQGGKCNIICTQPRRISAVGVAERVAAERCEKVGDTVGYQIRLESRVGQSTRLTFCTTGILLRRMTSDQTLAGVSHIMVDEVHERDLQTDFLLVILRDLLHKRPDLRVVLMSATLQADLFTSYFEGCPSITIPGRTFPVEITYMDNINRLVRGSKTPALMPRVSSGGGAGVARRPSNDRKSNDSQASQHANMKARQQRHNRGKGEDDAASIAYDPLTGKPLGYDVDTKTDVGAAAMGASAMVSPKCEDKVDYDIIVDLVDYIMTTEGGGGGIGGRSNKSNRKNGRGGGRGGRTDWQGQWSGSGGRSNSNNAKDGGDNASQMAVDGGNEDPLGAILIFLPGFFEIDQLVRALERHPNIGRGSRVFPLHSSLPPHQQKSIFQRMPPGVRKIVVSTNIAETSVTIDDCTHVIDAGRVREMRYDPISCISCLVEVWISKASGSQRAGRAGRVRRGKCWRLYPEAFHESFMPPHTLAEMLRTPLEELVLQVLLLELGSPAEFLGKAVEPPPPKMLRAALRNLYDLQAIVIAKSEPILTPLGYHLAHLPMDARVGKLLLIAAILQCLDPILTIAAALSDKAPFQRPFGEQVRADAARQKFAQNKSDHLAIVEAFGAWRNKRRTDSYAEVRQWCRDNFLSHPTLERLDNLRKQFRQQLAEAGFASSAVPSRRAAGRDAEATFSVRVGAGSINNRWRRDGEVSGGAATAAWEADESPGPQDSDLNAGNIALVQSVLCAGLYPHVAAFVRPDPQRNIKKGHFVTRDDSELVFMHPSSVNHRRFSEAAGSGRQVYVMYHSKMKTKQVYLHDSTYATPFSLVLWGAHVRHERPLRHTKKDVVDVVIDRWLRFRMTETTAVAFKAMRRELNNLLVSKIEAPFADSGSSSGMIVSCLERLLNVEARKPYN